MTQVCKFLSLRGLPVLRTRILTEGLRHLGPHKPPGLGMN